MNHEFVESPIFTAQVSDYLADEDYAALQVHLCENPDAGVLVRHSGGVRKLRWARLGGGKSGRVRVCYYVRTQAGQILMLLIYAKNVRDPIPGQVLAKLCKELESAQTDRS